MSSSNSIIVIKYPFGDGSAEPSSYVTPDYLEQEYARRLEFGSLDPEMATILKWVTADVPPPLTADNYEGHEPGHIRHKEQVMQAVSALANTTARCQMSDLYAKRKITLTLGGDHTQGLSTIKATLLSEVARAIVRKKIPLYAGDSSQLLPDKTAENIREEILIMSAEGRVNSLIRKIEECVERGYIKQADIERVMNSVAVIWFDSHGDSNNAIESPSGNAHGMSLGAAMGLEAGGMEALLAPWLKVDPDNVYVVGSRALDPKEKEKMRALGVHFEEYDSRHMQADIVGGIRSSKKLPTLPEVITGIRKEKTGKKFVMSLDVDGMDSRHVPSTGTAVKGGPSLQDTLQSFHAIANDENVLAIDITEGSPGKWRTKEGINRGVHTLDSTMQLFWAVMGGTPARYQACAKEGKVHFRSLIRENTSALAR